MASTTWFAHPERDAAIVPLDGVLLGPQAILAISSDIAMDREDERASEALENILMLGYPNGLYDRVNFTPMARRGITATPISLDYEGKPAFCIDAATFPGCSGSPVFCLVEPLLEPPTGFEVLGRRLLLAGVVSELHESRAVADVRLVEAKTGLEFGMKNSLHLGVVEKARTITECVDIALASLRLRRAPRCSALSLAKTGRT